MQTQTKQVDVELGGVKRNITIERTIWENGSRGCWFAKDVSITCRFRTGSKLHTVVSPQVFELENRQGIYHTFGRIVVVRNRHAFPITWTDLQPATSNWKREHKRKV